MMTGGPALNLDLQQTTMTAQPETMDCKTQHHSHSQKHGDNHKANYGAKPDLNQQQQHEAVDVACPPAPEQEQMRPGSPDFYRQGSTPHRSQHGHEVHISPRTSHVGSFAADSQPGLDFKDSPTRAAREKERAADYYSYGSGTGNRLAHRRSWSRASSRANSRRSSVSGSGNISSNMATLSISPIGTPIDTNALDAMEKEQEGIVMRLMHEIQTLKDENKMLKNMLRTSSVSSANTESSPSPISSGSSVSSLSSPSTPFMSQQRRATFTTMTNMKRVPANLSYANSNGSVTNVSTFPRSRSGSLSMNWKASTLSPKLSGVPNITLTESFPFDTEYFSLTPHRSSFRNPSGALLLSIPHKILSYSNNNEEAIDDANLDQPWESPHDNHQPPQQRQPITKGSVEDSGPEPSKLKPFKKLHKRSVSDTTDCSISKQYKLDSLAIQQSRGREGKPVDGTVSSGLMIRHFDGK